MKQDEIQRMLKEGWIACSVLEAHALISDANFTILWRPNKDLREEEQYCLVKKVM